MEAITEIKRAERIIGYVTMAFRLVAGAFVCALVVLVCYGALSRYLFSRPVFLVEETGGLLFMAIAFLSFPYVFIVRGHISLSLVTDRLPEALRKWVEVVQGLACLIFLIIFSKVSWDFVYVSYQLDCHSENVGLYEVPWQAILPASMVVMAIVALIFVVDRGYSNVTKMEGKRVQEEAIIDKTM